MAKGNNVRMTNELKNPTEVGTHYRITCMTGANKGKVYYITGKRAVIGRGDNSDIQIIDTKMSKEHAELSFADGGYTITDLGSQNGLVVGDARVKQKKIIDGDKIVVGQSVLKYNVIVVTGTEVATVPEGEVAAEASSQVAAKTEKKKSVKSAGPRDPYAPRRNDAEKNGVGSKSLIMLLIVGGVLYALFPGGEEKSKSTSHGSRGMGRELEPFAPTKGVAKSKNDAETKKKLEMLIHSGRREFSEGNYFRAMEDFRLALLLNPNDGHASFYLSKAKQRLDEDIEKNFLKGKQEHESKKLQAAIVSYCSVVQLIQNYPDDERYKNAMLKISAIESELGLEKGEVKCFEAKSDTVKN
jgi:pSer/pThr/pTyr-binding forkhead associated (FHA) protein